MSQPYGYPAAPKRKKLPFILGGAGVLLLLCVGGTVIAAASSNGPDKRNPAAATTTDGLAKGSPADATTRAMTKPAAAPTPSTAASKAVAAPPPTTVAAKPTTKIKVPNGVGLDYQSAQDLWRAAGLHVAPAHDATGAHRLPVLDANWVVLSQNPKAGAKVPAGSFITATVKKYSDD
jgi:hypothetical protein